MGKISAQAPGVMGMNNELKTVFDYMEKERGLNRDVLIQAVEGALLSAARKSIKSKGTIRVEIDRSTYDIKAFAEVSVVEKAAKRSKDEISLSAAKKINPEAEVGGVVEIEVTPKNFGRIAAQTAKQAIIQKIRQAEKTIVFEEFKDRVGEIISGTVRRFQRSDVIMDLGRADGIMPAKERMPTEEYQVGDRIRAYVVEVDEESSPSVILSRNHPDFVRKLFEMEISEIADNVVEIKGIARDAGYRTKIAVVSHDEKVDAVGACVGMRGMRVKNIVRELSGEKIDIIRWSDDVKTYVGNALAPASLIQVLIDENNSDQVQVIVDPDQLSLAIGKRGQNVRLTAKLLGKKVDIRKDESSISFEEKVAKAIDGLAAVEGIDRSEAETLVKVGFLTTDGILAAEVKDLAEMTGFDETTAQRIYDAAAKLHENDGEEQQ